MNGNKEYNMKYQNKINKLLESNNKLNGFYSFIGNKSISTVYNYLLHINSFLSYIGNKPLKDLNIDDFSGYMMKIQNNRYGEGSTSSYKIVAYSALKKYGTYLVALNVIDRNPMDFIDRPKPIESQKTIAKREIGYLSKKEISQYITSVEQGVGNDRSRSKQEKWKERDLAIVMTFLNTGIRCSALMKIDVGDIDFEKCTLSVTDKGSEPNTYEISEELLGIIETWLEKREKFLNGVETEALFISNRRTRMTQQSIYVIVKKYAEGVSGKHITPHKLRATYGTQLYNETKDVYFVQSCMKHSNPKTTELYIRGNHNQTRAASDIMKKLTIK